MADLIPDRMVTVSADDLRAMLHEAIRLLAVPIAEMDTGYGAACDAFIAFCPESAAALVSVPEEHPAPNHTGPRLSLGEVDPALVEGLRHLVDEYGQRGVEDVLAQWPPPEEHPQQGPTEALAPGHYLTGLPLKRCSNCGALSGLAGIDGGPCLKCSMTPDPQGAPTASPPRPTEAQEIIAAAIAEAFGFDHPSMNAANAAALAVDRLVAAAFLAGREGQP